MKKQGFFPHHRIPIISAPAHKNRHGEDALGSARQVTRAGFTLIEMLVVMGVISTLMAYASTNLLGYQRRSLTQTTQATLIADLEMQRLRAMNGDTQGRDSVDSYGIYIEPQAYTLFHGETYSSTATGNITIPVESPLELTTTFAGSAIIFSAGSGALNGYTSGQSSITLHNRADNSSRTLLLNEYGTIVSGAL